MSHHSHAAEERPAAVAVLSTQDRIAAVIPRVGTCWAFYKPRCLGLPQVSSSHRLSLSPECLRFEKTSRSGRYTDLKRLSQQEAFVIRLRRQTHRKGTGPQPSATKAVLACLDPQGETNFRYLVT